MRQPPTPYDVCGPVAERRRRGCARPPILVRIQVGPPTFAASPLRLAGRTKSAKVARRSPTGEDGRRKPPRREKLSAEAPPGEGGRPPGNPPCFFRVSRLSDRAQAAL